MILDKIKTDIIRAMKENKPIVRNTLRFFMSKIQQYEKDKKKEADDEITIQTLKTLIKQNEDTLKFKPANAQLLMVENSIWNHYIPKQLSEEETKAAIELIIKGHSIDSIKRMGFMMKELRAQFPGTIDMKLASKITKELLT